MGLAALNAAFPERPLSVSAPISTWRNWLFGLILLALPVGLGWWAAASLGPSILTDLQLKGSAVPVQGSVQGRCSSRYGLLQTCDMTVTAGRAKDGQPLRQGLEYFFVDPHVGNYTVQVMADPGRPGLLTTDMGLDNLTSRMATLAVAAGLCVLFVIGGVSLMLQGRRQKRLLRAMSGQRLTPVPVFVTKDKGTWTVVPAEGNGESKWQIAGKREPFWLSPSQGIALGVTTVGGPVFPLDRDLQWVDLTNEERDRLAGVVEPAA